MSEPEECAYCGWIDTPAGLRPQARRCRDVPCEKCLWGEPVPVYGRTDG